MIERQIAFTVEEDRAAAFERFIGERYASAVAETPGFVRWTLGREAEEPGRYQLVLRFETVEASAAWRTSPDHQALAPDLRALASIERILQFDVIA